MRRPQNLNKSSICFDFYSVISKQVGDFFENLNFKMWKIILKLYIRSLSRVLHVSNPRCKAATLAHSCQNKWLPLRLPQKQKKILSTYTCMLWHTQQIDSLRRLWLQILLLLMLWNQKRYEYIRCSLGVLLWQMWLAFSENLERNEKKILLVCINEYFKFDLPSQISK